MTSRLFPVWPESQLGDVLQVTEVTGDMLQMKGNKGQVVTGDRLHVISRLFPVWQQDSYYLGSKSDRFRGTGQTRPYANNSVRFRGTGQGTGTGKLFKITWFRNVHSRALTVGGDLEMDFFIEHINLTKDSLHHYFDLGM